MHLNDFELGTLMSGFLIVYMLAAPVFGRLGDRGSRPRPIAIGVFVWSLATGLSGLARSYVQLLAARAVVGIGEAAYATIAPSLLADSFVRRTRGRAFAIFNMAIPVGAALGYIVGGVMRQHFGWHAAFYVAGIPGVLLALWILRLPDPPRGAKEGGDGGAFHPGRARTAARFLGRVPAPVARAALCTHRPRLRCLHLRARRPGVLDADLSRGSARHPGRESLGGVR